MNNILENISVNSEVINMFRNLAPVVTLELAEYDVLIFKYGCLPLHCNIKVIRVS